MVEDPSQPRMEKKVRYSWPLILASVRDHWRGSQAQTPVRLASRLGQHFLKLGSLTQREEVPINNRALAWLRSCTIVIAALGRQR